MGIQKSKSYTAYLSGGTTFRIDVQENGIVDLSGQWANSESMELDELCLRPEDLAVIGELFTLAGQEVNS